MFIDQYLQQISGERLQDHWSSGLFWESGGGGGNHGWGKRIDRFYNKYKHRPRLDYPVYPVCDENFLIRHQFLGASSAGQ